MPPPLPTTIFSEPSNAPQARYWNPDRWDQLKSHQDTIGHVMPTFIAPMTEERYRKLGGETPASKWTWLSGNHTGRWRTPSQRGDTGVSSIARSPQSSRRSSSQLPKREDVEQALGEAKAEISRLRGELGIPERAPIDTPIPLPPPSGQGSKMGVVYRYGNTAVRPTGDLEKATWRYGGSPLPPSTAGNASALPTPVFDVPTPPPPGTARSCASARTDVSALLRAQFKPTQQLGAGTMRMPSRPAIPRQISSVTNFQRCGGFKPLGPYRNRR